MKTNIPAFLNLLLCPKRVKHFKLTNTTVILSLLLEVPVSLAAPSILEKYDPLPDFSQPSTPRPAKEVAEIFYEPEDRIDRTDSFNVMYTSASYSVTDSAYISLKGSKTSEDQNVSVFHSSGGQAEFRFGRNFYLEYGSLVRTPNEPYGSVTALYAEYGGKIYADGERAKVVVLSPEPIAITAKDKSSEVIINATNNVVVGGSYIIPEFSPYFLVTAENELKVIEGKAAIELHLKEDNCRSIKNHLLDNQAHISTVFSGDSSLWFGDEHSSANANITLTSNVLHDPEGKLSVKLDVSVEDWEDGGDIPTPIIPWFAKKFSTATLLSVENDKNTKESSTYNNLDVTLENGAQWVYFGVSKTAQISKPVMLKALAREIGGFKYVDSDGSVDDKTAELDNIQLGEFTVSFRSIPKRLSSLTLNKGGIVNLSDSDAQNLSRSFVVSNPKTEGGVTSLADVWPELLTVKHNYVRFGELKSTTRGGGIFRLDINGNRNLSDMIFVEGSSTGGKHFIEIASFKDRDKELRSVKKSEDLNSLADDQKIRFATVAKDSNISFSGYDPVSKAEAPSVNYATPDAPYVTYYGNELHDITFYIGSEDYTPNAAENAKYEDRVRDDLNALGDLDAPVTAADGATEEKNYFSDSIVFDPDKQFEGGKNYYLYLLEPEEEKPDEKPKPDVKPAIPDQPYSPIAKAHFGLASWLYGTYLDRLNKRLGEVRYQNEDAGLWVRGGTTKQVTVA